MEVEAQALHILQRQYDDLRTRLDEAEEILRAISQHEVDAFIVKGSQNEQVFTLRGAEHAYRVMVETINEGAASMLGDGTIFYCNQALASLLRQPLAQTIGAKLTDFVAAEDLPRYTRLLAQGAIDRSKGEITLQAADGTRVPVLLSFSSLQLDEVQGICLIATDLTEQKHQAKLVAAEKLARSILEQANEAIVVCDASGQIIRASQRAHQLCGHNPILQPFDHIFPLRAIKTDSINPNENHESPAVLAAFSLAPVLAGVAIQAQEVTFTSRENRLHHLLVSAGPLTTAEQEQLGCVITLTDITELKQIEFRQQLLIEAGEEFAHSLDYTTRLDKVVDLMVAHMADICLINLREEDQSIRLAAATHRDPTKTALVHVWAQRFPLDPEASTGTPEVLRSGQAQIYPDFAANLMREKTDAPDYQEFLSQLDCQSAMIVPLAAHGRVLGAITFIRGKSQPRYGPTDLAVAQEVAHRTALALDNARLYQQARKAETELQQLNAVLEQRVAERTAELQRSNRELDQFAYVASHDLKAPLRSIEHLVNWISEDAGKLLPEMSQTHLVKLSGRVRRMEILLNDLLTYSRVGRIKSQSKRVDTGALVQNIIELLTPPSSFIITMDPTMPILHTAATPLETVLRNLINNAFKHHDRPEGHIHIAASEHADAVEFAIIDDGPGIEPEFHTRIFELFQTLKPRDQVEGSGMGLAIVQKTIINCGGTIWVESGPGRGTTFRFTWPK